MPTSDSDAKDGWEALVGLARDCFSAPSLSIFTTLLTGWVLAPARRTVTAMIAVADPDGRRAHDAYHRFLRAGRWSTNAVWKALVVHLVATLCSTGTVTLDVDDTLYKSRDAVSMVPAASETQCARHATGSSTPPG